MATITIDHHHCTSVLGVQHCDHQSSQMRDLILHPLPRGNDASDNKDDKYKIIQGRGERNIEEDDDNDADEKKNKMGKKQKKRTDKVQGQETYPACQI